MRTAQTSATFPPLNSPMALSLDASQALLSCTALWTTPHEQRVRSATAHLGESATLELTLHSHLATALELHALHLAASDPALSTTLTSLPLELTLKPLLLLSRGFLECHEG